MYVHYFLYTIWIQILNLQDHMINLIQLTYFIFHFLQFVLRATHDHNIHTTPGKLQKINA